MKKLSILLLLLAILLQLAAPISAVDLNQCILDRGQEFNPEELEILEEAAYNLSYQLDCGIYYLSVSRLQDLGSGSQFADLLQRFYKDQKLGKGVDHRGIILAHSLEEDQFCIYACGRGERIYEDSNWQTLTDVFLTTKSEQGIYQAVLGYLDLCSRILKKPKDTPVPPVVDMAGILTDQEFQQLTDLAQAARDQTDCGIYIYIIQDYRNMVTYNTSSISRLTEALYRNDGYGTTEDRNGIFLFLSMEERDYDLYFHGFCDSAITDRGKDHIEASFLDDFRKDSWYNGLEDYVSTARKCTQMSLDGHPYNRETYSPAEHIAGLLISICMGTIIAGMLKSHFVKQMNSVEAKTQALDFTDPAGLQLTLRDDEYNYTSTHRVYDPPKSSGSSSGSRSRSRSGGSHRSGKF